MTLTDGGKDWLATHAGKNDCFSDSGVTFKDAEGNIHVGGTSAVLAQLYTNQETNNKDKPIVDSLTYNDFYAANGNNTITLDDVQWVANHESGAAKYCAPPPGPGPGPTGKGELCVLTSEPFADIYIDDETTPNPDLSPSRSEPPYKCTEVSATPGGIQHKVTAKKAGYKAEPVYIICIENQKAHATIYLEPEAGTNVGTLVLRAYKEGTTEEIHANFDIEGLSGEEKFLTPHTMNIKAGTYKWIRFYCTGFETYEATNVTVEEGETTTVTAYMKPKRLWKQVYVGPPIALLAIEDFDIPSRLYWDNPYDFSVTIRCFEAGWYYANIELREPGDFMTTYDPADLGPTRWTIPLPEKEISYFDINTPVDLKTTRIVPGPDSLPAGTYVAVVVGYSGRR